MINPDKRVRSMDTLRSLAILMVLLAHIVLGFGAPPGLAPLQLGGMGVDLFFVLSGWLLGGQLFKEMESGRINIRRFWVRRWIRTLPAYYVVLLFTVGQQYLTKEKPADPLAYFVFMQNYDYPLKIFFVSWSLAVEEQFYLFIAPFLAVTLFFTPSMRMIVLAALFVAPSIFRYLGWFDSTVETHVRLDGCIMGVILAGIRYQHPILWSVLVKYSGRLAALATLFFGLYFYQRWFPLDWLGDPGFMTRAIMFGSWVIFANSGIFARQQLYFPGAYYIATRSYAIYLLHPEAIAVTNRFLPDLPFIIYMGIVVALSISLSEVLFRLVEKPFMELRSKVKVAN